jgi:regulator of sirC expression with transglutaminase-like and TPR domain
MDDAVLQLGLFDDEAITLDAAALQLAALDRPGVDLNVYVGEFTAITERFVTVSSGADTAHACASALSQVFSEEYGSVGDRVAYDDPDNADLIRVIQRRRGLLVSLTVLYVAAARRVSWHADALNTPGHVLARVGPHTAPVLIDPFNSSSLVGQDQLASLLSQMLGQSTAPAAEHLAPMSNRRC